MRSEEVAVLLEKRSMLREYRLLRHSARNDDSTGTSLAKLETYREQAALFERSASFLKKAKLRKKKRRFICKTAYIQPQEKK